MQNESIVCACGCGQSAAAFTKQGLPRRFVHGHNGLDQNGTLPERIWRNIERGEGCWEFQGARDPLGYGRLGVRRRVHLTHRLAYWYALDIPVAFSELDGWIICHRCDNPPCIRPAHLFLGTRWDNNRDRFLKGRTVSLNGAAHPRAKLTQSQVDAIRLLGNTVNISALARQYDVDNKTMWKVVRGKSWH